jgi:hypothetical protein
VKERIVEERATRYGRRVVKSVKGRIRVEKQVAEEKKRE